MNYTKKAFPLIAICLSFFATHFISVSVHANETTTDIKNTAEDVKTDTKKGIRKLKRKGRRMMGTDSTSKDVKDSVEDAKDGIHGAAKKVKNKIED